MAAMDSVSQVISRLCEAMASNPLTSRFEDQLRSLEDVDARNAEGRTLIEEAVVCGRRDWVETLLEKGADPGIGSNASGETALELARQMADQHRGNGERRAILRLLEVVAKWHDKRNTGRQGDRRQPSGILQGESQPMVSGGATPDVDRDDNTAVETEVSRLFKKILKVASEGSSKVSSLTATGENPSLIQKLSAIEKSLEECCQEIDELSSTEAIRSTSAIDPNENPNVDATELSSLENLLGVTLATCGRKVVLPRDKWQILMNSGASLLMKAAIGGAAECVDLLLRCGVDVNCLVEQRDLDERAIYFAVEGGHEEVVLNLLRWDSLLPIVSNVAEKRLKSIWAKNVETQGFLREREVFHKSVKEGNLIEMEDFLERNKDYLGNVNYWVNVKGRSSLYSAAYEEHPEAFALLKSKKFNCAPDETVKMDGLLKSNRAFRSNCDRAMDKYFVELEDCHVYKMVSRTRVLAHSKKPQWAIKDIYEEANKVGEARLLLQCLEDEPHFEVIFDVERSDVARMCIGSISGVRGIQDSQIDRVYASASLETLSDVVSNLVHELCHKVMHVIFGNGGLPYKKNDAENEKSYREIADSILSSEILSTCNEIIQRVNTYPVKDRLKELIVRIPEIITKYQMEHGNEAIDGSDIWKNRQECKLFDFYSKRVEPEIKRRIESNITSRRMPICDLLKYPALMSDNIVNDVEVGDNAAEPTIEFHHGNRYFQVSNLKLGVSHLKMTMKDLVVVDYGNFHKAKSFFELRLKRGTFKHLAVVLNKRMDVSFCSNHGGCEESCPAKLFSDYKETVTLVIPKKFSVPQGSQAVEYGWGHLSERTKDWILNRDVNFQGKMMKLRDLTESVVKEGEDVQSEMGKLLDANDLSNLIDLGTFALGRNIESDLSKRLKQLLRDQPEIPRKLRVRHVDFKETLTEQMKNDAVFIFNAEGDDLKNANVHRWRKWNGDDEQPEGIRFFLVDEERGTEVDHDKCRRFCEQLQVSPATEGNWRFAHLFRFRDGKFDHLHSQRIQDERIQLLADVPGSGKSVISYTKALGEKREHDKRWVEVVELTDHESAISKWNGSDRGSNADDLLFEMIGGKCKSQQSQEKSNFEKELFKKFCSSKGRLSIYFDGFDEICPDFKEKCSMFLDNLAQKTEVTLFLTTRTHERLDLEKLLSIVAYNMTPFDEEEQISFMKATWSALLKSMDQADRDDKIKSIVRNVKARRSSQRTDEMVERLEQLLGVNAEAMELNFNCFAEELMHLGNPTVKTEVNLFQIPLHIWMLATVCFHENFNFAESMSLTNLYERFIELKINTHSSEKAKINDNMTGRRLKDKIAESMRMHLKKFAAMFFLGEDVKYELTEGNLEDIMLVGLVIEKGDSRAFIHRTIGEYLLSVWLLEEAEDGEVTRVFLSRVLSEDNFEKVRTFINEILLHQKGNDKQPNQEIVGYKNTLPNASAFPETRVRMILNSLYKSIEECHCGILRYLADFSESDLAGVLFGEDDGDSEALIKQRYFGLNLKHFDAFSLCGEFTKSIRKTKEARIESLETLQILLNLAEKNHLIENLRDFISKVGFWWTGVYWEELWYEREVISQFHQIFDFLLKHKNELRGALRDKIMDEESKWLFANASVFHSFDLLQRLLDSILEERDFEKLLVPSSSDDERFQGNTNMATAWTRVILFGKKENVEEVWNYFEKKLTTNEKRKEFLRRRRDMEGRNAVVAALISDDDGDDVISHVSRVIEREFSREEEMKEFVRESLTIENPIFPITNRTKEDFENSVIEVIRTESINLGEALQRLRYEEKSKVQIYNFVPYEYTLSSLLRMQEDLTNAKRNDSARGEMKRALERTTGCLRWLSYSCLYGLREVESSVLRDFHKEFCEFLSKTNPSHFALGDIPLDEDGHVMGVSDLLKRRVKGDSLIAFFALLRRRLEMESEYLTAKELKERFESDLLEIYITFPVFRFTEKTGNILMTKSLFIQYFFAVLSKFLTSREDLSEVLLHEDIPHLNWNIFHGALYIDDDVMAFLTLYDLARLHLGENALWRVHSITQVEGRKSILELLIEKQDNGRFIRPIPTLRDFFASHSSDNVSWDLRSYSQQQTE